MTPRRLILCIALALLLFLGIYTLNQRTGTLDAVGAHSGLEFAGAISRVARSVSDTASGVIRRYFSLMDVREENDRLQERLRALQMELSMLNEDKAELTRLRALLNLDYAPLWPVLGARVLAGRMGPNSALESIMLSRGYLGGARPGTPIACHAGLVGRVLKAGPSTSVALLITDPGSRVAVIGAQGRAQGILSGGGAGAPLELRLVRQNSSVEPGEILVTSGLDSAYPKGIPVARMAPPLPGAGLTQAIQAEPLAEFGALEEVLLLEKPEGWYGSEPSPVYTRTQPHLTGADLDASLPPMQPIQEDAQGDGAERDPLSPVMAPASPPGLNTALPPGGAGAGTNPDSAAGGRAAPGSGTPAP